MRILTEKDPLRWESAVANAGLRRQNNSRLDELSSKVTALRGVTVDIYDNARDQGVLDSSVCFPLRFGHGFAAACCRPFLRSAGLSPA